MLIVVERDSIEAAYEFISHEPYTAAELLESVSIRQWHHVIPEPEPNYMERELQKEVALLGG